MTTKLPNISYSPSIPPEISPEIEEATLARAKAIIEDANQPQWYGAWVLFVREVRRFWSSWTQTVISPVLTTLLYFLVFGYSLGGRLKDIQGIPYMDFLVPGLVMLGLINNAYLNSAFSLFIAKIHGILNDVLVTPLSYMQWIVAYTSATLLRAMMVGCLIWISAAFMGASTIHNIPITLLFMILTAMLFSFIGMTVAIVSEEFDQINFFPSFLLTPLTFLGGVFYSIEMLPTPWSTISYFNPVLYMISGLRYGMTGVGDVHYGYGLAVLFSLNLILALILRTILKSGYKIRH